MPPKGSKVFHPNRDAVNDMLDRERDKFQSKTPAVSVAPDQPKELYFHRCIIEEHRKFPTASKPADFGSGNPSMPNLSASFSEERIVEVLDIAITYMAMLWVLTFRTAKERVAFVDLTLWPGKLGVPHYIIDKMWDQCRKIEMTCNAMYPSILGPLNPGWVFRVGLPPTHLQLHMELKNTWVSKTLSEQHMTSDIYDCMHNSPHGDKKEKADSRDNFFFNMYRREEPAGGRFKIYNPRTGLPVRVYVKYKKNDRSDGYSWLELNGTTDDELPMPDHEMSVGESYLFWTKGPPTLQNGETRAAGKRRHDDIVSRDVHHGLTNAKVVSKTMVPHTGQLSQQERINQHPPIDIDKLQERDDEMNLRFASGALRGLQGGFDMSDNFASPAAQHALDVARAKGMH